MNEKTNGDVLDTIRTNDMKLMGYDYIAKVISQSNYYKWDVIKISNNVLTIHKHDWSPAIIEFSWSYNESKVYFNAGPLAIRLVGTQEALEAALKAVDTVVPVFNELVKNYEL